ncbi:MAG: hypothetical protein A2293_10930 [Elusimicrobia bacterium RIFOXYB2_FULL_49_7]|nr:MAG: hypothetical protein A2293_10930 [Elusimicrobia bacterium RIFOXYB2_FULL_49_7]
MKSVILLPLLLLAGCTLFQNHPQDLTYRATHYVPPSLPQYRHTLDNGIVVFVVEDDKLPLFDIQAIIRTGGLMESEQQAGLSVLTADLLATGGTETLPADTLDDRIDFHAASLSSNADGVSARVSLSIISTKLDTGLALFTEVMTRPAFESKRIDLSKTRMIEGIHQRFDHPKSALSIAYNLALYGKGRLSVLNTETGINIITRNDIETFYHRYYRPENVILAVSGRFKTEAILTKLNVTLGQWKKSGTPEDTFPAIPNQYHKRLYFIEKEINQAYIRLGLPALKRPHPDYYPLALMNYILGGAPFTSRISKHIREEEGLAYSAGSFLNCPYFYTGYFGISLETKSASAAYAIGLAVKEIEHFIKKGATDQELADAKKSLIDAFPAIFRSGSDIADAFAMNHYLKRSDVHFDVYRDSLNAITLEDIARVARQYLVPESLSYCMVGKWADCEKGDGIHPVNLSGFGVFERMSEQELERRCTEK